MIRSALSAGLTSMGVNIDFVGVLPTPGISYLTRKLKADAGIMISASHNPVKDNGIKIFSSNGYKLPDGVEEKLEELMENRDEVLKHQVDGENLGRFRYVEDDMRDYLIDDIIVLSKLIDWIKGNPNKDDYVLYFYDSY